jgi:hypothetical protein
MRPRPRLIWLAGEVLEIADVAPGGSMFLLNRSGILRRRIAELERELAAARAELAGLEAEASGNDGRGTT